MTGPMLARALTYAGFGATLALAYFAALGWNVRLYAGHGAGWSAMLVHLTRLLGIGVAFALCARQGALPLLSSVAGFQIMRTAAVKRQIRALARKS